MAEGGGGAGGGVTADAIVTYLGLKGLDQVIEGFGKVKEAFTGHKRAADEAGASAEAAGNKLEKAGSQGVHFAAGFKEAGQALTAGVTVPLFELGKELYNSAANMQVIEDTTKNVFGKSAEDMNKWAEQGVKSMGMSASEALTTADRFGVMATGLGLLGPAAADQSEALTKLTADMGAFANVDPSVVQDQLTAALKGSAKALKGYGIDLGQATLQQESMKMGWGDSLKALTPLQLEQVRYNAIMDQSGKVNDQFAQHSGRGREAAMQFHAVIENLKDSLGTALYPRMVVIITKITELATWVANACVPIRNIIILIGGFLAVLGPASMLIGTVITLFGLMISPIGLIIAALALLGYAYKNNIGGFGDLVNNVFGKVKDAIGSVIADIKGFVSVIEQTMETGHRWRDEVKALPPGLRPLGVAVAEVTAAVRTLLQAFDKNGLLGVFDALPKATVYLRAAFEQLGRIVGDLAKSLGRDLLNALEGIDWGGVASGALQFGVALLAALGDVVGSLPRLMGDILSSITTGFAPLDNLLHGLGDIWGAWGQSIRDLLHGNWLGLIADVHQLLAGIGQALTGVGQLVIAAFKAIPWGSIASLLGQGLVQLGGAFANLAGLLAGWLGTQFSNINWGDVWAAITSVGFSAAGKAWDIIKDIGLWLAGEFSNINWGAVWAGVKNVAVGVAQGLGHILVALAAWLAGEFGSINWGAVWSGVKNVAVGLAQGLGHIATDIGKWLGNELTNVDWGKAWSTVKDAGGGLIKALGDQTKNIERWAAGLLGSIVGALGGTDAVKQLRGAAGAVVDGFKNGFSSAWDTFKNWVKGEFDGFISAVKTALGVASPSSIFNAIAGDVVAGFLNGLRGAWGAVTTWVGNVLGPFKDAFTTMKNGVVQAISDVTGAINGILDKIKGPVNAVVTLIGTIAAAWKAVTGTVGAVAGGVAGGAAAGAQAAGGLLSLFGSKVGLGGGSPPPPDPGTGGGAAPKPVPQLDMTAMYAQQGLDAGNAFNTNLYVGLLKAQVTAENVWKQMTTDVDGFKTAVGTKGTDTGNAFNTNVYVGLLAAQTKTFVGVFNAILESSDTFKAGIAARATNTGNTFNTNIYTGLLAMQQRTFPGVFNAILSAADTFNSGLLSRATNTGNDFNTNIYVGLLAAQNTAQNVFNAIANAAGSFVANLGALATAAGNALRDGLAAGESGAETDANTAAGHLLGALNLGSLYSSGFSTGDSLGSGLNDGISIWTNSIAATAAAAVSGAINAADAAAGHPHSPSPTMLARVGSPLGEALHAGVSSWAERTYQAAAGIVNAVTGINVAGPGGGALGAASGNAGGRGNAGGAPATVYNQFDVTLTLDGLEDLIAANAFAANLPKAWQMVRTTPA